MSGTSFTETCPNCGQEMQVYSDWKPYSYSSSECMNCGWFAYPQEGFMSLTEVNERRADYDLKPIKKLKPVSKKYAHLKEKRQ